MTAFITPTLLSSNMLIKAIPSPRLCSPLWVPKRFVRVLHAHKPFPPITKESLSAAFYPAEEPTSEYSQWKVPESFPVTVWSNFISEEEEKNFVDFLQPQLARKRYSPSHFDGVICNYREKLLTAAQFQEKEFLQSIYSRVQQQICGPSTSLSDAHVLDIAENGFIAPHVDTEFTGGIVAGLTLLSDAVVTFQPHVPALQESLLSDRMASASAAGGTRLANNPSIVFPQLPRVELFVPARSLYILTQEARYEWTHAIEMPSRHSFRSVPISRGRRISVMFRDELPPKTSQ